MAPSYADLPSYIFIVNMSLKFGDKFYPLSLKLTFKRLFSTGKVPIHIVSISAKLLKIFGGQIITQCSETNEKSIF